MTERGVWVRINAEGDIPAWKAVVGGKRSHALAKPTFPAHQPNYNFDNGVLIRVKSFKRVRGEFPLSDEFARRK
ncbi:MAG TPA: hypothetical protein VGB18_02660 [Candidatus Thermoplasmatota archaeon]